MRYRNEEVTSQGTGNEKYKTWYSRNDTVSNEVEILMCHDIVWNVVEMEQQGERIMKVKLVLESSSDHVFLVYAS